MSEKLILPNSFLSLAEEELREGKKVKILADGSSMFPFIKGGEDISVISPIAPDSQLKLWHVYMFRWQGNYVIHRFVGYKDGKYLMNGDGNIKRYETIHHDDVIGCLDKIIKPSGKIIDAMSPRWLGFGRIWFSVLFFRPYLLGIIRRLYRYGVIR